MALQSILVPKTNFNKTEATEWIKKNGHKALEIAETKSYFSFRLARSKGFVTKCKATTLPNGIILIFYSK